MSLAILVTGEPVPSVAAREGPFAAMITRTLGDAWRGAVETVDLRDAEARAELLARATPPAALIITGSPANVPTREPSIVASEALVRTFVLRAVPTLGLCFGHQLLAQALGGEVARNPEGREIGTVTIERVGDDPWLADLPPRFAAHVSHVDTVVKLPPGARVLARSARDRHQCLRFAARCYGVQFHPEFDRAVISGYLEERRAIVAAEGQNPSALIASVCETPHAAGLLERFVTRVAAA